VIGRGGGERTSAVRTAPAAGTLRVVELSGEEGHKAVLGVHVVLDPLTLTLADGGDAGAALVVGDEGIGSAVPHGPLFGDGSGEVEDLERSLDGRPLEIDLSFQGPRADVLLLNRREDLKELLHRWNRRLNEELGDLVVLSAGEQDDLRSVDVTPGAAYLPVIEDDRAGALEMDDESQVGLVEAHTERDR
jgi:hypothetical protein